MEHIFFYSCSVDGHLGCFHVLSIVSSAAVNIGAQVSFAVSFLRIDVQEVGLVDHVVVLVSVLLSLVVVVGFFFFFLGPYLQAIEAPRLGVSSDRQLLFCATAPVMPDRSPICNLHYSSWQPQILHPLSEPRDLRWVLMDSIPGCFC